MADYNKRTGEIICEFADTATAMAEDMAIETKNIIRGAEI